MNSSREGAPFFSSNLVVFGTTIMMTSLMAVPSGIGTVYAAADTVKDKKNNIQANKSYTTLNELSIPQGLDSGTTLFDLKTTVTISGNNQSEFNLNVSPNIAMDQNLTSIDLKDNSGQIIGQADLNHDLNQIVVTLKQTGTFKTNLIIPVTLKNTDMTEQVVTLSHNDQMLSQHVVLNKEETAPSVASSSSTQETETSAEMVATDQSNKTTTSSSVKVVNSSQSVTASDTKTTTMSSTAASSTTSSTTAPSTTTSSSTTTASSSNSTTASSTSETTTSSKTQETTTASTKQEAKTTKSQVKSQQIETRMNVPQAAAAPAPMVTALGRSAQSISPQHDFVSEVAPHAQRVAGANDLYASVMIAQSILESGYGNSTLSQYPNHNLFGIKGKYQGQSVKMLTWEHINGQDIQIYDDFRKYPSFSESFEDNARVIKTTSFYPGNYFYAGAWKSNTKSYRDATAALTGKYATDPNYNNKLNSLIEKFNLTQYDGGGDASGTINVSTGSNTNSNESSNTTNNGSQQIHTVQRGDTLFAISRQYDVSIGDLMSWNGLSNHTIYVGQKLTIRGSSGGGKPPVTNEVKPDATIEPNTSTNGNNSGQNQTNGTYTVKSGDTLYGISRQTGMSVAAIKSANSLSSDTIYVGQQLKVNGGGSTSSKPTSTQNQTNGTYTVKSGDTLYGISRQTGMSVAAIKSANSLSSDTIYVGQQLKVNGGGSTSSKPTSTQNQTSGTYTVKSGDTLYGISRQTGMSVAAIKSANSLSSDTIYVGQQLKVNGGSGTSSKPTTAKPTSTQDQTNGTYTVKSGDTLYQIAKNNGLTVAEVKSLNRLSSDIIYVGQKLTLKEVKMAQPETQVQFKRANTHKVQGGETLWALSQKYGVSVARLKSLNNLSSDIIYSGQVLKVS